MIGIIRAYSRAVRSLFLPGMLFHFLWPVLASLVLWVTVGIIFWGKLAFALIRLIHIWPALSARLPSGGQAEQLVSTSLHITLFLLSVPLVVVTSVFILESVALPIILEKVAKTEYPHIERRHGGSQMQSLRNTLRSFLIAVVITIVTLPFWLIPGVGVVVSLLLSAWLNYRSFRYDVLMNHADTDELQALPRANKGRLFFMALGTSTLILLPPLNLLAVPIAGLSFAHYLLQALQRLRESTQRR
jgi:CysZ protein